MLITQQALLIFLIYGFLDDTMSSDLSANCTFDQHTFCGWRNEEQGDHFQWSLRSGPTPSRGTGPNADHTGNGSYVYIEASSPRKHGEWARLTSPTLTSPKHLRFFYHMHGRRVNKLTAYVEADEIATKLWERTGDRGDNWLEGCAQINTTGKFRIIFEGLVGISWDSDIAIDDISFTDTPRSCSENATASTALDVNCTFDGMTFCGWHNGRRGTHFEWTLRSGRTPSVNTGPSDDHTGNGYYAYIESSDPRIYNEVARLSSPLLSGPKRFRFFFHMYGRRVDSLSVHIRENRTERALWRRIGDHGNRWLEGCVLINSTGRYQITLEARVGMLWDSDIAIDDVSVTDNLQPCPKLVPPFDETLAANCSFDKGFCGWVNLGPDLLWQRNANHTPGNNTGPSGDHTGNGYYVYVHSSSSAKPGGKAVLEGPQLTGPVCMKFYHHMFGDLMGRLEVQVAADPRSRWGIWGVHGNQGDKWDAAEITIRESGPFQVLFKGTIGGGSTSDMAVDDVSFTPGECVKPMSGDCDFDMGFCYWANEKKTDQFDWSLQQGPTPSTGTGPGSDHTSGSGGYIFMEASSPRAFKDQARLVGPKMQGVKCLSFYYHMYGSSMGCITVYVRNVSTGDERVLWLKSGDRGNSWWEGFVTVRQQGQYQIVIEGTRGHSFLGDAAIDDLVFLDGSCNKREKSTFYVSADVSSRFQINLKPHNHDGRSEYFKFDVDHPTHDLGEQRYFIYPQLTKSGEAFLSRKLAIEEYGVLPLDYIVEAQNSSNAIYFVNRAKYMLQLITLENYSNFECCNQGDMDILHVHNITLADLNRSDSCLPGWFQVGKHCHLFHLHNALPWALSRVQCNKHGGDLAVQKNMQGGLGDLSAITSQLGYPHTSLYVGLQGTFNWIWQNTGQPVNSNLWGPGEPSGDGQCGALLNAISWDSRWAGKGWRWNDLPCDMRKGYICEDYKAPLNPVAFYPLDGFHGTADMGPNPLLSGQPVGVRLAEGPFGNPNGSFYFEGSGNSYVEFKKSAALDTKYSISIFSWIYPEKDGPIFNYMINGWGMHLWVNTPLVLFVRFVFRDHRWPNPLISSELRKQEWNFVGTTYDGNTGLATLWIGNRTVLETNIGKHELATQYGVRMGARIGDNRYFRGKIACLQVYAEAIYSSEEIMAVRKRCSQIPAEPIRCRPGFVPIQGGCYLFNTTAQFTWHEASQACSKNGTRFAVVDRANLQGAVTDYLYAMRSAPNTLLIGLVSRQQWSWIGNKTVNSSLWMPNFPKANPSGLSCAVLPPASSKLISTACTKPSQFVCQTSEINVAYRRPVSCSSALPSFGPERAVDDSYFTCFRSKKEPRPWLEVNLDTPAYVYQVSVRFAPGCCQEKEGEVILQVVEKRPSNSYSCNRTISYGLNTISEGLHCQPPVLTQHVRVSVSEGTTSFAVCHVAVYTIGSSAEAHGVMRESWFNVQYDPKLAPDMLTNPTFKTSPQGQNIIRNFDAPVNAAESYVQRLAAHIQVETSGNYTFYMACDDMCELWKFDVHEDGMDDKLDEDENAVQKSDRLMFLPKFTGHLEWKRYPGDQTSKPVPLSSCNIYKLQAFMRDIGGPDNLAVAMRTPNGDFEEPIRNHRLYWSIPGKRSLSFIIKDGEDGVSTSVGSELRISGYYSYCCHGVYCPDCPLKLNYSLMGEKHLLHPSVPMDCRNYSFSIRPETEVQPGNYSIKIHHAFVNESGGTVRQRNIANLEVKGYFAFLGGDYVASLESQLLPWKRVHKSVGLCLRFLYLMPNNTASHLKVLLRSQNNETLLWHLTGYHGVEWSRAQVSWAPEEEAKVIFEGTGVLEDNINVAVDAVTIKTEACSFIPYYAKPDFRCTAEQFQCDNGACIKKNLACDGDYACLDDSDESRCACPSNRFSCLGGGCVSATVLCDGVENCGDGSDESNCGVQCDGDFQCADGTCIPWSRTCDGTRSGCNDNTHQPTICEMGRCSLEELASCPDANSSSTEDDLQCRSFRGFCGFENDLCGMIQDLNSTFFWALGPATTPTDNTGPSYDHTTFTKEGMCIFIEASQRRHGDRARLVSGGMDSNETVCLQFWYHMHGKDIGNLSVYIKTEQSEALLWRQAGEQGNRWRFAQTSLWHRLPYKFVLEGVTAEGNEGDIAIDDLAVMDGSCENVTKQESPDCYFEEDSCGWEADDHWSPAYYVSGLQAHGGFLHLIPDHRGEIRNISTPLINANAYKWKCLRFWYYIAIGKGQSLRVEVHSSSRAPMTIFHDSDVTRTFKFVQRPIYDWKALKIVFNGYNDHHPGLAIDDVSFSAELCTSIPSIRSLPACGNFDFEKGTLEGWTWEGAAFIHQPTYGDNIRARTRGRQSANLQGKWWVGTYENRSSPGSIPGRVQGDQPTGRLVSPLIRITGPVLSFMIGGRCDGRNVALDVIFDDQTARFTSNCNDRMTRRGLRTDHKIGSTCRLVLIDSSPVGHINFDDLRGDFDCIESQACDLSECSLCGWRNQNSINEWKPTTFREVKQINEEIKRHSAPANHSSSSAGKAQDIELHMVNVSAGHVTVHDDVSPFQHGLTLCFWLRTQTEGFFVEYNIAVEGKDRLAFSLFHSRFLTIQIVGLTKDTSVSLLDGSWHHVCEVWDSFSGILEVYQDGRRVELFTGLRKKMQILGGGSISIGYRVSSGNDSTIHGILAALNLWDHALSKEEVLRMSFGCGEEAGNVKSWSAVVKGISGNIAQKPASCKDREANRLLATANSTTITNVAAVLVSPRYPPSKDWFGQCLRFRYLMFGPGAKKLRIYQKVDSLPEKPMWEDRVNTLDTWKYGQAPLAAVSEYKILIKAELGSEPGYVAIGGVHVAKIGSCALMPPRAVEGCSEHLTNTTGFFFSPAYPSYYPADTTCVWRISVPPGYVIRLEFREFIFEDHPTCDNDFVKVLDGLSVSSRMLGKFCGFTYPPVVQSSSRNLMVIFHADSKNSRTGFKAFYRAVKDYEEDSLACARRQGCPTNCECAFLSNDPERPYMALLVEGKELLMVPGNFPADTAAMMFRRNRISQLREGSFSDLLKLEYMDLSDNIILYVDGNAFHNLSALSTVRLNSNFIRNLPVGVFQRITNLRVLDLSHNLLDSAADRIFNGLSRLSVLALHSNRIRQLELDVFNSTRNLTFLYLQENKIDNIPDGVFSFLSKLEVLDLSSNEITSLTKESFRGLHALKRLYLQNNKLSQVSPDAFSELSNLEYLELDRFILCCFAKKSIPGVQCESPVDEFSSCDDLMKNKALQVCIWILGVCAFLGNLFVIVWRLIDKEEGRVQSLLLMNLAIADFLMGVYLLLIAIMDVRWQGEYFKHDSAWRSGLGCKFAGILSMVSSEVSVLTLTIITTDRLVCIVFPFKFNRLRYNKALLACSCTWLFGLLISVLPVAEISYFYDKDKDFGFYSRSAVCLPLQLSDDRPVGWEYALAFFIGLNTVSFLFILSAYVAMFWTVKSAARAVRSTSMSKESAMAKRLLFIVMTDFFCWMPIIVISILSLVGKFHDPQKQAYVWIAVFVLPLNSSINPILYTFSTTRVKKQMARKRKSIESFVMRNVRGLTVAEDIQDTGVSTERRKSCVDDLTVMSSICNSPQPCTRDIGQQQTVEQELERFRIRLVEVPAIFQDEISSSVGYVIAWLEGSKGLDLKLLKMFRKDEEEAWKREVALVAALFPEAQRHPNLMNYHWHSEARNHEIGCGKMKAYPIKDTTFLICYDFVTSTNLEDFLTGRAQMLDVDTVYSVATDVINAIVYLEAHGISHNNITTRSVLIGYPSHNSAIGALLGGFSRARRVADGEGAFINWACVDQKSGGDLEQFGQLLAILLGHCHGSSEYTKLHEIMNVCFGDAEGKRPSPTDVKSLLENVANVETVWDTCL